MTMRFLTSCCLVAAILILTGCAGRTTPAQITQAQDSLHAYWDQENAEIKKQEGTRLYRCTKYQAYIAAGRAAILLGMNISKRDETAGIIEAKAKSPTPLSPEEWIFVVKEDTPKMLEIVGKANPHLANHWSLTAQGFSVIGIIGIADIQDGALVTIDFKSVNNLARAKGEESVFSPPPTASKIGIIKWWDTFETLLGQKHVDSPSATKL